MKQTHKDELISALMDGECQDFETRRSVDLMLADDGLRGRWNRYHVIGDVLRRDVKYLATSDFCDSVTKRLEYEHLEDSTPKARQGRWLKPLLGFAVAATVAGVMVLGMQSMLSPGQSGGEFVQRDLLSGGVGQTVVAGHQSEQFAGRMNSYLLSHAEQTSGQGVMPYVRIVSYTTSSGE